VRGDPLGKSLGAAGGVMSSRRRATRPEKMMVPVESEQERA